MWFGVLGPLEARDDGGAPVRVGGPMRRVLLGALLCRVGTVVTAEALVEDLWGSSPPRSAAKTLQSHVVRLRDDLGRTGASVIVTTRLGYGIDVPAKVDSAEFEAGLAIGLASARRGEHRRAVAELEQALTLWRGEAYVDFGEASFAVAERMRLAELRAQGLEARTDSALAVGEAATLISELEARVRREPYRERSWEQLILALYRSGRQADALSTYRIARDQLATELGVDPGPALARLEGRILQHDPSLWVLDASVSRPEGEVAAGAAACPYRGLDGYSDLDGHVFVGRERLTARLLGRLAESGFIIVTGPSGSGKSSLVRAGLVPALRAGALPSSASWRVVVCTPGTAHAHADAPDVLVVDQAEELFTLLPDQERSAALSGLRELLAAGTRLVLVLRADFFGRLADDPWLSALAERSPVLVGPMRDDELRRVVLVPARQAGVEVDLDVVDAVLDDAHDQPQPLPLISMALVRVWTEKTGDRISLDDYERSGGVAAAIEVSAEAVYGQLDEAGRGAARRLLVRMATNEGGTWVRRPMLTTDVGDELSAKALTQLTAARLVTVAHHRVELSHDALLERWPRLRGWLEERVAAADLLEHLRTSVQAWIAGGRSDGDLYRGPRLQSALDWRAEHDADLLPQESEYLDAASAAADTELRSAQRQNLVLARGRRRLRRVVAVLAVVLVGAIVASTLAVIARSSADRSASRASRSAQLADARRLAATSLTAPDISTSAQLAAAAYALDDSPDTRGALLSALQRRSSARFRIPLPRRVLDLVTTPDGSRLYAMDNVKNVYVIDTVKRAVVGQYPARATDIEGVTGGALVVAGSASSADSRGAGRVSVLAASTGKALRILATDAVTESEYPVLSSKGRWLLADRAADPAAQTPGDTLELWDTTHWSEPPRTVRLRSPIIDVAAGTDTAIVITADQTLQKIDLSSRTVVARQHRSDLPRLSDLANRPAFALSPDGSHVVYIPHGHPGQAVMLATSNLGGTALPLPSPATGNLAFSGDSSEIAIGDDQGGANIDSVANDSQVTSLPGNAGRVLGIAWSSGAAGTQLYTAGLDSEVVSWDVTTTSKLVHASGPLLATPDQATRIGDVVVGDTPNAGDAPSRSRRLFVLDPRTGTERSWPLGLTDDEDVIQVVSDAAGRRALVSIVTPTSGKLEVWDLITGSLVRTIPQPATSDGSEFIGALSADGQTAVVDAGRNSLSILAIPSGRVERTFTINFAGPAAARIYVNPWLFAPDGRLLIAGYDPGPPRPSPPAVGKSASPAAAPQSSSPANQRLALVDLGTGRVSAQLGLGDIKSATAAAWSHDQAVLAVGTYAGTLATYDARTLAPVRAAGTVHAGAVLSISFAPDDKTLVSAGTDAALNFFDASSLTREGERIVVPTTNASWWFAWYNAAGDLTGLVPATSAADDTRWFTFPARPSEWHSQACGLANGPMSAAQWAQYVGDRPYQRVC